jgi:hypothetical protein
MRSSTKTWCMFVAGLVVMAGASVQAAEGNWYDAIAIGGHVQGSYVTALGKDTPQTNQLRVYDANNGFNINQAQIRIGKPVGDDNYGFGIKLLAGNDAESIHSNGLGTATDSFDLQEAYVNMAVPAVKGLTFTGGKFVTTAGVEVIESPLNLTIEPGLLFFYGLPFTHTGVKAGYTVNDMISVMAGVVNGWDQVQDTNAGKTMIFQVATTPMKALTANFTGSYGPELLTINKSKRTHLDFVLGYTGIDKLSLNAEALWGQDSNVGGVDDSGTTPWSGFGLWAGYAASNCINPGVRFEVFKDQHNANRLGSGMNQTAKSFTLLNKFVTSKATFVRLQYRYDWSNEAAYTRDDGTFVSTQKTISADWVVTF